MGGDGTCHRDQCLAIGVGRGQGDLDTGPELLDARRDLEERPTESFERRGAPRRTPRRGLAQLMQQPIGAGVQEQPKLIGLPAVIYDGGLRGDAARIGSVGLQTVRDWVLRFNGTGPDGLVDGKAPGQTPGLNKAQRQALVGIVESGPIPAVHGVVRWRLIDLAQWVWDEFGLSISKQTLSRELRTMGFRKLSARPRHHAQNEHAVEA